MEALGMQKGQIPDSAITASSSSNVNSLAPYLGRLHSLSGSWAAATNNEFEWFQINLGSWRKISAVETQGRHNSVQYVKTYILAFSYDEIFWETVKNEHGLTEVQTMGIRI